MMQGLKNGLIPTFSQIHHIRDPYIMGKSLHHVHFPESWANPYSMGSDSGAYFSYFSYFSARPAEPSSRHASTTRAAIADSASRPHERGS